MKIIRHLCCDATINRTEKWLMTMSKEGWRLVGRKGSRFYFEQSLPKDRRYFINPIFDSSRGFHSLFHKTKLSYGVADSKSPLNKQNISIIEIDCNKIDKGFEDLLHSRNAYCKNHFFRVLLLSVLLLVGSIVVFCFTKTSTGLLIIGVVLMIPIICYSFVSLSICYLDDKNLNENIKKCLK